MNAGAFANDERVGTLKIVYKIQQKTGTEGTPLTPPVITIPIRVPKIGDIVAFGDTGNWAQNQAHVGIYLGSGVFLNATPYIGPGDPTTLDVPTAGFPTTTGGVGIKFVPGIESSGHEKIIYRSIDGK